MHNALSFKKNLPRIEKHLLFLQLHNSWSDMSIIIITWGTRASKALPRVQAELGEKRAVSDMYGSDDVLTGVKLCPPFNVTVADFTGVRPLKQQ